MAIVVPFLIANTAIGAAAAAAIGVGVGTLATLTTVAFAVTGVNDKINKAAASVFGEDLVKVANIAGMAYGAWNGGFSMGDTASAAGGAADMVNGLDSVGEVAAGATDVAANAADAAALEMAGGETIANMPMDPYSDAAASMQGFDMPADVTAGAQAAPANTAAFKQPGMTDPAATPSATIEASAGASGANATASQFTPGYGPSTGAYGPANASDAGGGFFNNLKKMVTDPKTGNISNGALQAGGSVVQGVFGGYSAAKAREQQREQYDAELARRARLANLGTAGWVQTQ